jgi:hypothetical protein
MPAHPKRPTPSPSPADDAPDATQRQPDPQPRDDYEPDDPNERAGLRRPRGGTPNVPR